VLGQEPCPTLDSTESGIQTISENIIVDEMKLLDRPDHTGTTHKKKEVTTAERRRDAEENPQR